MGDSEELAVKARPLRVRDCYPKKADFEPGPIRGLVQPTVTKTVVSGLPIELF
jgi:hypothetical protein